MRMLTRYVAVELAKVFVVSLTALTLLIVLFGMVREAGDQGLGPAQVLRLIPFILPDALRFAVPGTILFAACVVYGRMSGSNEILAIKSLGISPMAVLWPVFILGFLLSLVAVWLNDVAVSWGQDGVRRVVVEAVEEIAYGMLRTQRTYSSKQFTIVVQRVEGRKLIRPLLTFHATGSSPPITIAADEAELDSDLAAKTLSIAFTNSTVNVPGEATAHLPGSMRRTIPLEDPSGARMNGSPALLALRTIPPRIDEVEDEIKRTEEELAARAAYQVLSGDLERLASGEWEVTGNALQDRWNYLFRLKTEPPRRWANGFSCLFFVLVGAPMAIRLKNSDVLHSFFACFLPILVVYYPLLTYGVDAAKRGAAWPTIVWMGNGILALWGAWLLRRVVRF